MAVIINEFEVITEAPRPTGDASQSQGNEQALDTQRPPLTPDTIGAIWRRELEREARTYAG